jgi:antitoxin component of RelBE/YafQ-DinJ toxin-antitoxin module
VNLVRRAYFYAEQAHDGQRRRSGEAYVTHPLAVANILADMHMDHQSLMAAMLHDVIEDTGIPKEALVAQFGETVAELVDGVSKLTQMNFETKAEAQAENFQKMAMAMARDIRVILVKLADRLHNMRTLEVLAGEKRRRIAKETLEIYAPIANRLGMHTMRVEFEDLGFKAMHPMRSERIRAAVRRARGNRNEIVEKIEQSLIHCLEREGLEGEVLGREKHLYSIYKKMRGKRKAFHEIMDVYAFRIVVDKADTCYRVLGAVHSLYKPLPGRFKDYIAIPKANGYQSLHTTLFGMHGVPHRDPDPHPRDGRDGQQRHRRALAVQVPRGRSAQGHSRPRPPVGQGCTGAATACRQLAGIHRECEDRPVPRRGLRLHPQGPHHGDAQGFHRRRLRLCGAYRCRQYLHRLSRQPSPGAAVTATGEWFDGGDRHRTGRAA